MDRSAKEKEKESSKQGNSGTTSGEGEENSPSATPTTSEKKETPGGQGSESEERTIEVEAATGAIDFNHPLLQGKSPEEIERIVEQQEKTIRSQNQELNSYHTKLHQQEQARARPSQQEEEDADPYGDSMFAESFRKLEQRVNRQLEKAIAPLQEGVKRTQAMTAREKLRQELPHFERLEPHIDQLVREHGVAVEEAKEGLLRTLYYTAVGIASSQGIDLNEGGGGQPAAPQPKAQPREEEQQPQGGKQNMNIPQHRPSSSPMPQKQEETPTRDLTEEERKLAQHYGMTDEEYLEWMNKPVDEVATPGYSRENW